MFEGVGVGVGVGGGNITCDNEYSRKNKCRNIECDQKFVSVEHHAASSVAAKEY